MKQIKQDVKKADIILEDVSVPKMKADFTLINTMRSSVSLGTEKIYAISWLNIAKAIGIICIALGHSKPPTILYSFFYYFHIPLFFFISGYLFNKKQPEIQIFIKKKFKTYMIPYFIYGFIFTIMMIVLLLVKNTYTLESLKVLSKGYFFGQIDFMANKNLWFLPSLFLTVTIGLISIKYLKLKSSWKNNLIFFFLLFFSIWMVNGMENYYMSITTIPASLLFFITGYHYKNFEYLEKSSGLLFIIILAIVTLFIYIYSYYVLNQAIDIGNNRIRPSIFMMLINGVLGIYLVVKISKFINKNALLEYIGKLSLYIFIFHQVFTPLIDQFYNITNINEFWLFTGFLKVSFSIFTYLLIIKKLKNTVVGKYL